MLPLFVYKCFVLLVSLFKKGVGGVMVVKKREYLLRGSTDYNTATDEELFLLSLSEEDKLRDFYDFYNSRARIYEKLNLGIPNAYQRYWMYWRFKGGSVITTGPVGIGKTTFALIEALLCEKKSIVVVPTKALAIGIYEKLKSMNELSGKGRKILVYDRKTKESIKSGEFDIAVLTSQAFRVIYPEIGWKSSLSIVDDVDAFVKNPKNLDRLMDVTKGSIILSSATFKASPSQMKRLREQFGISFVKTRLMGYRNVADIYDVALDEKDLLKKVANFILLAGSGGIVFLPRGYDEKVFLKYFNDRGIRAEIGSSESLKLLEEGKVDVLLGKAAFYGTLVRGIDMPDTIRYVVFAGVPRGEIVIKKDSDISRWWKGFIGGTVPDTWQEIVKIIKEVAPSKMWSVNVEDGEITISYPDLTTYIQASGRTSRFTGKDFTFGLSFVVDSKERLNVFIRKATLYGISFERIADVDIEVLIRKTIISRKENQGDVRLRGALMLVESPHKVDTISLLLGGGVFRYVQTSSGWVVKIAEVSFGTNLIVIGATVGHTSDIVEKSPDYWEYPTLYGVSVEGENFYPIMDTIKMFDKGQAVVVPETVDNVRDKLEIIKVYRNIASIVDEIWLATDPDSEGERIAYEVGAYLSPFNNALKRLEFREITRKAIVNAMGSAKDIDTYRVDAALTRRIEDRWVGFFLSERLSEGLKKKGLSGGRVQSPVLGWIIDRYNQSRKSKIVYRVAVPFIDKFYVEVDEKPPMSLLIDSINIYEEEKHPLPPYSTDSLLADASRILGFSSSYTMQLAQDLFEGGFITYHRTDSVRVSDDGIKVARMYLESWKKEVFHPRRWDLSNVPSVGGAHECIRPTKPIDGFQFWDVPRVKGNYTRDHGKLYGLIFRRFMASQMISAVLKMLAIDWKDWQTWKIPVEAVVKGYLEMYSDIKLFTISKYPRAKEVVQPLIDTLRRPTAWPMKEEDVIRQMKERSIGRPSTYGKILQTIKDRGYVKVSPKGFLIPTLLGMRVWNYLKEKFPQFVSENRTASLYKRMDDIESGKVEYMDVLREVFKEIKESL